MNFAKVLADLSLRKLKLNLKEWFLINLHKSISLENLEFYIKEINKIINKKSINNPEDCINKLNSRKGK